MTSRFSIAPFRRLRVPAALGVALGLALLQGCAQTPAADASSPAMTGGQAAPSANAPAPGAASATPAAEVREPAVVERLGKMSAYLRTLKSFSVAAQTSTDEVTEEGQKLQFNGTVEYRFVAPDKLKAMVRNDRKWRDYYYDGKTITQAAPRIQYYASVPMTGSVGEVLGRLNTDYDVEVPLADLFLWGTPDGGEAAITSAILVGPAQIGGVECDHFAMRQPGVDWQLWVQKGAQPLPRKIVITTTEEPEQPQYSATLNWNLNARPAATEFTFKPTKGDQKIVLAPAAPAAAN